MKTRRTGQRTRVRNVEASATRLPGLLYQYLEDCHGDAGHGEGKKGSNLPFPNLAGFCRWLGVGLGQVERLRLTHPEVYDLICTVLEDEVWNSAQSASLIATYVKQRLWRESVEGRSETVDQGQLRLVFEHDIREDGQ